MSDSSGEDSKKNGADTERRAWHRVCVNLDVDYSNTNNFLFAYISDISETGIFIRTNEPEKVGTLLNLRFTPDDGIKSHLLLEGEVQWVNDYQPDNPENIHPGMGVQFVGLAPEDRFRLIEYIKTFAYLDDPTQEDDYQSLRQNEEMN